MDLKHTCTEIVNAVFDLSKVPGETRLKVREQAVDAAMDCFIKMQIVSRLTEQNLKILELLGEGDSAKRIAGKVHLSKRTVEYHFGALQRLFNCKNNVQLVKRATDYKII